MEDKKRAQWGSKLGFILAAAGSAIGLGNIWKFPGRAYEGGGGTYILVYLLIVILIGFPVMLSELAIGRAGGSDAVGTFEKLDKRFKWLGYVAVIVPFIITAYYAHVGGWVLRYVFGYMFDSKQIYAEPTGYFYGLLGYDLAGDSTFFPWIALIFAALFLALSAFVVIKGVQGGIERFNKVGMPALLVLLIILLIRSTTLEGAAEGLRYMLSFDWSKMSFATFLSALGQAFYSLSLGMGIMITYGSYLRKEDNIYKNSMLVCTMDTVVALIAAFIIVPACFATLGADGIGKGAGFAFVSLAGVFEALPAGAFFGVIFYLLLLFAALTSTISLIEVLVSFMSDHLHVERKKGTIGLCIVLFLIGCVYTCSQVAFSNIKGIWFDFANGLTFPIFGDFMEFLTDRLLVPVCALGVCIFAGHFWKPESVSEEIGKEGTKFPIVRLYGILIRYIVPAAIALILVISFITGTTLS